MEGLPDPLPLGATGHLEAQPLTNAAGDHAMLVRQGEVARALLTGERGAGERDRVVIVPLDDDVELRVDGDAMAVWLARGSVGRPQASVPAWASAMGYLLLMIVLLFTIVGSVTVFSWLFGALGLL